MSDLTRVALDACAKCMTGLRDGPWRHYPESWCDTEGCHNRGQSVPWIGLREHVKVMWPAPLVAVVEAAREASLEYDSHGGPETHSECPLMGMHACFVQRDMGTLREAISAWDHFLEGGSGGERPGNGVESLREPSMPALTHGVSGRSPALPADPAAVPPATSPASDVHAGGGAPASETWTEHDSAGYPVTKRAPEPASEELLEQPTGLLDDLARQMGVETPAERKEAK